MPNKQPTLADHAHRDELVHIYADTLWVVDNLRIAYAHLEGRGVELTNTEKDYLERAMESVADIQARIESRIPRSALI